MDRTTLDANVLLVDDKEQSQKIARAMLERLGCTVMVASSGAEAFTILKDQAFDIIFMDCEMPDQNGYETTQQIRQECGALANPNPIVVALTASSQKGAREQCLQAGMNDYLCKPLSLHYLHMCVERWMDIAA